MNPIAANTPLSVTLEAQQWNAVIAALSEAPYRIAAPLIQSMSEQLQQNATQENVQVMPRQNGAAEPANRAM
jgi:uncharacterized Zn finger protein